MNLPNKRMTLRAESWLNKCLDFETMATNIERCSSTRSECHSTAQLTRFRAVEIRRRSIIGKTQTIGHLFIKNWIRIYKKGYGYVQLSFVPAKTWVWSRVLCASVLYICYYVCRRLRRDTYVLMLQWRILTPTRWQKSQSQFCVGVKEERQNAL